jgi:hypothetical protein
MGNGEVGTPEDEDGFEAAFGFAFDRVSLVFW